MFEELATLRSLLEVHVVDFMLAVLANSSDKSLKVVLANVDFLRQMAFGEEMNYRFKKIAVYSLQVIHYNYFA